MIIEIKAPEPHFHVLFIFQDFAKQYFYFLSLFLELFETKPGERKELIIAFSLSVCQITDHYSDNFLIPVIKIYFLFVKRLNYSIIPSFSAL